MWNECDFYILYLLDAPPISLVTENPFGFVENHKFFTEIEQYEATVTDGDVYS